MPEVDHEVNNVDDAQSEVAMLEGDLNDLNTNLEDHSWVEAIEQLDEIEERLKAIRAFVTKKAEN